MEDVLLYFGKKPVIKIKIGSRTGRNKFNFKKIVLTQKLCQCPQNIFAKLLCRDKSL
jgi:hypothetical protein